MRWFLCPPVCSYIPNVCHPRTASAAAAAAAAATTTTTTTTTAAAAAAAAAAVATAKLDLEEADLWKNIKSYLHGLYSARLQVVHSFLLILVEKNLSLV